MICVDNSEWSRNGDYTPSRFDCQSETANLLGGSKTAQNPETGVGLLTMAGEKTEVLLTPTTDLGAFMAALGDMQIKGKCDFVRGIQTATLALKHRQNKNQKQRIICFVGSPVESTEKQLETLGKNLKKNNVSLDVVSLGEITENKEKLDKLIAACNSNETSHLVEVPVGPRLVSDIVLSSEICFGEGGAGGGGAPAGSDGFEFGVDPNTDPELALALRISMEEERRRNETPAEGGEAAAQPDAGGASSSTGQNPPAAPHDIEGFDEMDDELRQALLMSMDEQNKPAVPPAAAGTINTSNTTGEPEQKKQKTEPSSTGAAGSSSTGTGTAAGSAEADLFQDPDFVKSLLGELPGVDLEDARIKDAIGELEQKKDGKDGKKDGSDKKDGDKK